MPTRASDRLGGRLVTGPAAFLICGVIDVSLGLWAYARARAGTREL